MKNSYLRQTAAAAALLAAQPALADVTAEDAWGNLQSMIAGMNATIANQSSTRTGDTLSVSGIVYTFEFPEGSMTGNIEGLSFRERGDGTVRVTLDGAYTLALDMAPENDEAVKANMSFEMPGLEMIASGVPQAVNWDYSADEVIGTMESLEVDGEPIDGRLDFHMGPSTGKYSVTEGDTPTFTSTLEAESLTIDGDFIDPDDAGTAVAFNASYTGLSTSSAGNSSSMMSMSDPESFLGGDAVISGSYAHAGSSLKLDVQSVDEGDMAVAWNTGSGSVDFALDGEGVTYDMTGTGLSVSATGSAIPLPEVSAAMEEFDARLKMPLKKSDTATDVALLLNLGGLTVSEMLWSMVDPSGGLPHDPATLFVSITGKMRLMADLDDEAMVNAPGPLVAFENLDLDGLTVSVAGAELTGTGGFDFTGAPAGTLPGMPGVSGLIDLRLEGANALLDKLGDPRADARGHGGDGADDVGHGRARHGRRRAGIADRIRRPTGSDLGQRQPG